MRPSTAHPSLLQSRIDAPENVAKSPAGKEQGFLHNDSTIFQQARTIDLTLPVAHLAHAVRTSQYVHDLNGLMPNNAYAKP
ncbi:MAG: hypothetical protein ACK5NE_07225 [Brachymonas sp.]